MITAEMKSYDFLLYGERNEYGQEALSDEPQGKIKMTIYPLTQVVGNSIKYKDATFIGFTQDKNINDGFVIIYEDKRLKVLYPIKMGRFTQVFLSEM